MRAARHVFVGLFLAATTIACRQPSLTIYFVDVEGGQSTLIVTPARQSLLIDSGYAGNNDRDANRIIAAADDAGIDRIDNLLITHFHPDHDGGAPALGRRLPIGTFFDYGQLTETDPDTVHAFEAYKSLRDAGRHVIVRPGLRIPLDGVEVDLISGGGETLSAPLDGAGSGGANAACAGLTRHGDDPTENRRSAGIRLRYGAFRFLDPGDLPWNPLADLVCPSDLVGPVGAYLVGHHANADTMVPALLATIKPRVAVVNNGPRKGGVPPAMAALRNLPGVAVWQLHESKLNHAQNAPDEYVANVDEGETGYWLKLTASSDGRFTMENGRNGFHREY